LVIALCTFSQVVGTAVPSGQEVWLYFHDPTNETYGEQCSGTPAGGFGWIQNNQCTTSVDANGTVGSDPGNNATQGCFKPWNGAGKYQPGDVVPIGLYNAFAGTGSNATYSLVGIAGLEIIEYTFPSSENPKSTKCPIKKENSCLHAKFTTIVTSGGLGGGTNYGASVIALVG
jgi:hypothetical protein